MFSQLGVARRSEGEIEFASAGKTYHGVQTEFWLPVPGTFFDRNERLAIAWNRMALWYHDGWYLNVHMQHPERRGEAAEVFDDFLSKILGPTLKQEPFPNAVEGCST